MSDFSAIFDRAKPTGIEPPLNEGVPAPVMQFWARVELMGHRIRYGHVREVEMFGAKLLRVDVTNSLGTVTEFYGGAAIYCLRPISEEDARKGAEPYSPPQRAISYDGNHSDFEEPEEHF